MIVITVTNCPPRLRGDLTKWMIEVNTGVYVGKLNHRVRDELWKRVCDNIENGQATMIYSTNNEQGYAFLTYNSLWMPYDYEGVFLIKKLFCKNTEKKNEEKPDLSRGFSKAAKYNLYTKKKNYKNKYIIIDVETTGLDPVEDRIIEIGMLRIEKEIIIEQFQCYINIQKNLPKHIIELTGITESVISEGLDELSACRAVSDFIGRDIVIGYNVQFDISFLENLAKRVNSEIKIFRCKDVLDMSKRKIENIKDYKLTTVADYFSIDSTKAHRALEDCILIKRIFEELNKM